MLRKKKILREKYIKKVSEFIQKHTDYLNALAKDIDYLKKETHNNAVRLNALVQIAAEIEQSYKNRNDGCDESANGNDDSDYRENSV